MKRCIYFIALLVCCLSTNSHAQLSRYKKIIKANQPGKVFRSATHDDTSWVSYLGVIKDGQKKTAFHVTREFYKVRAASTWHGHSEIYFFDERYNLVAKCYVTMPDNLPVKMVNNTFYFEYLENGTAKKYNWTIAVPLPRLFRSRPDEEDEIVLQ